jgi:hypothetical protein
LIRDQTHIPALERRRHVAIILGTAKIAALSAEGRASALRAAVITPTGKIATLRAGAAVVRTSLAARRARAISAGRRPAITLGGRASAEVRPWAAAFRARAAVVAIKSPAPFTARAAAGTGSVFTRTSLGRTAPNDLAGRCI